MKCKICGRDCRLGYSATVSDGGQVQCDVCTGAQRDAKGRPWFPGETAHVYQDVRTGKIRRVTRREAFGGTRDI